MQTHTPNLRAKLCLLLVFIFTIVITKAQPFYEPFTYGSNPGSVDTLSTFWSAHRGAGNNTVRFEPNGLLAPIGLPNSGGGGLRFNSGPGIREDINRSFTPQISGSLYVSFLLNIDSCNAEDYFLHLNTFTHTGRVYLKKQNNKLWIGGGKTGLPSVYSGPYNFNTNYLIVIKYEFLPSPTIDTFSLWVLSEPSVTEEEAGLPHSKDFVGSDANNIFAVSIRQGANMAVGRIDELRMANNWEDVVGTAVWSTNNSWVNGTPNAQTNVKIIGNFTPDTTVSVYNLHLNENQKLWLQGKELHIHGKLSGSGKIAGSNGAGIYLYQSAGTLFVDSVHNQFKTLYLHQNASLNIGSTLNMQAGINAGTLTLNSHASLYTGDKLVFLSNEFGSARLATLADGAVLSGKITTQKFIPARRAFRFLSTPVSTNNGVANAWQLGTHITGNGPGFDSTASKNASLFRLNEVSQDWEPFTNTLTQNLVQGAGYRILIRGNRSINLFSNNATPTASILSATGYHQTGDKTYNASSIPAISNSIEGLSLIGNPFPSAINWNTISRNQISSTYFTWRAQGGSNNKGAYVSYNANGQNSSDGNVNAIISSGAAIMIKTIGSNPSITIKESDKIAGNEGSLILGKREENGMRISLYEFDSVLTDAMYLFTHEKASHLKDEFDSEKWMNPGASLYSTDSLNNHYAIMSLGPHKIPAIIHLKLKNTEEKTYHFKINASNKFEKNWWLIDQYLNQEIWLDTLTHYSFDITNELASKNENRFLLSNKNALENSIVKMEIPSFSIYPNPSKGQLNISTNQYLNQPLTYTIYTLQGQIIQHGTIGSDQTIHCSEIGSGLFVLNLQGQTFTSSYKFMNQ